MSDHAFDKGRRRGIIGFDIINGVTRGIVVEDYPDAFKGPSVLLLQNIRKDLLIHVLWGVSKSNLGVASLITVYFPTPEKWYDGFMRRRPK